MDKVFSVKVYPRAVIKPNQNQPEEIRRFRVVERLSSYSTLLAKINGLFPGLSQNYRLFWRGKVSPLTLTLRNKFLEKSNSNTYGFTVCLNT